jgi:hypothetical protein
VPEESVLIFLIRVHVLRVGNRLSDNFLSDFTELHKVFNSIKTETEKITTETKKIKKYKCVFLLDVVAKDTDSQTQTQILSIVGQYVCLSTRRVSNVQYLWGHPRQIVW